MALRYWRGGTGTWDGTAGTKWAATANAPGGASVPTTADDVFFDDQSTGTVTIAGGNTGAKSIDCTGFTGTLTGTAAITVAGSITLVSGMTYTHTGTVTITATGTLTTAGKTLSSISINGSGITVTLGDALTLSSQLSVGFGGFNTANYNVTAANITCNSVSARTITLGSSTVTLSGGTPINFDSFTFNAGTSQINLTNAAALLAGGSNTFYNVSFTSTSANFRDITGTNTFNNLVMTASGAGLSVYTLSANQTVNGTLTCAGASATARCSIQSSAEGATRTIAAAAISANDCDFRDITLSGAAAGAAPTRAGDCGGNSGITFPAAKTVYRVGTNTTWAGSSSWATSSGGTGSDTNFPLAQDTAVINNDTALTGTLALAAYNIGALDCSARTTGITLNYAVSATHHGSHTLGSGVTVSGTSPQNFSGRGTMTFTSAGKTTTFPINMRGPGGTFLLGDALNSTAAITLVYGTFDANNYNVYCDSFSGSNSNTRAVSMGSGLWTLASTSTIWNLSTTTGLTFNKGTANILLSNTSALSRTFAGGGLSYNKLTIGGATGVSIFTLTGANSFTELASTKTVAHTVRLGANQGTIGTWSITGTPGNVVTVDSSSAGTRRTFSLTNTTSGINYLAVKDIGVNEANRFYVGTTSTDNGNNLNVIFTDPVLQAGDGAFFLVF